MNNFNRDVWCLFGLPVDAIGYDAALARVSEAARLREPCFFSTPNLNFIIEATRSADFRNSVLESDLVLLDGMPAVWIARMIGTRGIEKVSGSNLFESMWQVDGGSNNRIRVFLFGGDEGIAEQACMRINSTGTNLECVGFHDPGFVDLEQMSSPQIIDKINASGADFLLVALGAKKGQAWILANREKLEVPVVSHLGAVINFVVGNVARAPRWMQRTGLEWSWRIYQEPGLWRRYFFDAICFGKLLVTRAVPYWLWRILNRQALTGGIPVEYRVESDSDRITIFVGGSCVYGTIEPLRDVFEHESRRGLPICIDLEDVHHLDHAFLGLCFLLYRNLTSRGLALTFQGVDPAMKRIFYWNGAEWLL